MKSFFVFCLLLAPLNAAYADEPVKADLSIQDGKFQPTTLKVPAGRLIELSIENKGPGAEEFESKDLRREKVIAQGKIVKIMVGPLKKGRYSFYGEYHEDTAQGQLIAE